MSTSSLTVQIERSILVLREQREKKYDGQFRVVCDAIRLLMAPSAKPVRETGFHTIQNPKPSRKTWTKGKEEN